MKEIIVVGGGSAGALSALMLAKRGFSVSLVEKRMEIREDSRTLALSDLARRVLLSVGIDPNADCKATDIHGVCIRKGCGKLEFKSEDLNLKTLGFSVEYSDLVPALRKRLEDEQLINGEAIEIKSGKDRVSLIYKTSDSTLKELESKILVLADGGSLIEQIPNIYQSTLDYRQNAILFSLVIDDIPRIAYKFFVDDGALALIPIQDGNFKAVFTRSKTDADRILNLNETEFIKELTSFLPRNMSGIRLLSKRKSWGLKLKKAYGLSSGRVVLIGNAAQTLHPSAAQGFNLALRDILNLCFVLNSHGLNSRSLRHYEDQRNLDRNMTINFVHRIVSLLEQDSVFMNSGVMSAINYFSPLKRILLKNFIYGPASTIPGQETPPQQDPPPEAPR